MPSHPGCSKGLGQAGLRGGGGVFEDRHISRVMAGCGMHYQSHLLGLFLPLVH